MSDLQASPPSFGVACVDLDVRVNARPKRVWAALTRQTNKWWPKEFYTDEKAKGFRIEPKVGGRMFEDWGGGDGRQWGVVIGLKDGVWIDFLGYLSPAYGGPAHTNFRFEIVRDGETTILKVTDTMFGGISIAKREQTREGWRLLMEGALKPFVEELSKFKGKADGKSKGKSKNKGKEKSTPVTAT